MLELWQSGVGVEAIAVVIGCTWSRAIHEINRALNERNGHFGLSKKEADAQFNFGD